MVSCKKLRRRKTRWFVELCVLVQDSVIAHVRHITLHPTYGISEIKSSAFAIFWHKDNSVRVTSTSTGHCLLAI